MSKWLLLGVVSIAACVPRPRSPAYEDEGCWDDESCDDYEAPSSAAPSPFMEALAKIVADRATGFASWRTGDGVQVSEEVRAWPQTSAVLPSFDANACTVARYDDAIARSSSYVFQCDGTDTEATVASLDVEMASQIGRVAPSDWKRDQAEVGATKTWSWSPPGEEPAVYLREEPAGEGKRTLSIYIWSRGHVASVP